VERRPWIAQEGEHLGIHRVRPFIVVALLVQVQMGAGKPHPVRIRVRRPVNVKPDENYSSPDSVLEFQLR